MIIVGWLAAFSVVFGLWIILGFGWVFTGITAQLEVIQSVALPLTWGVFGIALGAVQWRVLRRQIPQAWLWILATSAGFVVAALVVIGLMDGRNPDTTITNELGHGIVLGATLGVTQWAVLRGKVELAGGWILISVVGWELAALAGSTAGASLASIAGAASLDRVGVGQLQGLLLLGGFLSGIGLFWLLKRSAANVPDLDVLAGDEDPPSWWPHRH